MDFPLAGGSTTVLFLCWEGPMTRGDEAHEHILDQALGLASLEGLAGLSIGRVASAVGLSKSGFYAHFGSKERLQIAILRHASDRFVEQVVAPALKAPRGEPRVIALLRFWEAWAHADFLPGGCPFLVASVELDDQPGPLRELVVQAQADWLDTLAEATRIAIAEGHFHAQVDADQVAYELFSLAYGYHFQARLFPSVDIKTRLHTAIQAVLDRARSTS